jgi:hypothetical protein
MRLQTLSKHTSHSCEQLPKIGIGVVFPELVPHQDDATPSKQIETMVCFRRMLPLLYIQV